MLTTGALGGEMNDDDRLYRLHADRLAGVCLRRDEALHAIDGAYRDESDTVSIHPDYLYDGYRFRRGSASAAYGDEIDEVQRDYRNAAGESAVPLPVPPREPAMMLSPATSQNSVPTIPYPIAQHTWAAGPLAKTPNRGLVQMRRGGIAVLAGLGIVVAALVFARRPSYCVQPIGVSAPRRTGAGEWASTHVNG